jgi:hypothetical protein
MPKLKLDVDALQVESFVADSHAVPGGTVHGLVMEPDYVQTPGSTECDEGDGSWGSLFGTCENCPTMGTCIGPTYCCPATWRTCHYTCPASCVNTECGA